MMDKKKVQEKEKGFKMSKEEDLMLLDLAMAFVCAHGYTVLANELLVENN